MSDEIPVGSPPVPPGRHAAPGGWYADPVDEARERYWDGWQWTRNVRAREGGRRHGRYAGSPPQQGDAPGADPGAASPTSRPPQDPRPQQDPRLPHLSGPPGTGPYAAPSTDPYAAPGPAFSGQAPASQAYRLVPATADGVPLAGWWWRVAAFVVDYFLLYAVTQLIAALTPLGAAISRSSNAYQAYLTEVLTTGGDLDFVYAISLLNSPALVILNIVSMALFVVYSGLMLRSRGATLGKLLFRLRVVPVDHGRSGPGLASKTAWLRPVINQLLGIVWLVSLVNYLFPLWDRRKQTLHDKVVATQVVREARR